MLEIPITLTQSHLLGGRGERERKREGEEWKGGKISKYPLHYIMQ